VSWIYGRQYHRYRLIYENIRGPIMRIKIYYFSGTGNSLIVARDIANAELKV